MYYGTPPIVTNGLVLHLDTLNPQSIPLDPTVNNIRSQSGSMAPVYSAATMSVSWSAPDTSWYVTFKSGSTAANYKGLNCTGNKNSPFVVLEPTSSNVVFSYKIQAVDFPISMSIDLNNGPYSGSSGNNNDNRSFETVSPASFILVTTSSAINVVARYTVQTGSADFTGSYYYTFNNIYAQNAFPINQDTTVRIWDIQHELSTYQTPFTATSRSIWYDLSGNNNHATLAGVARPIPKYNYSDERVLNFDGSGSYAKGPTTATWFTSSFSIEAWINPSTSPPAQQVFFSGENNIIANTSIHLRVYSYGTIRFGYYADDLDSPANVITFGKWNHVVCTYNSSLDISSIYINGVLQASGNQGPFTPSTANIFIGQFQATQYFKGTIGITRVYTKALTQAEILQNFNASKTRFGLT